MNSVPDEKQNERVARMGALGDREQAHLGKPRVQFVMYPNQILNLYALLNEGSAIDLLSDTPI